jgi:hypothetical protein
MCALLVLLLSAVSASAQLPTTAITSGGPLTNIWIGSSARSPIGPT